MRRKLVLGIALCTMGGLISAQEVRQGEIIPPSSVQRPEDAGVRSRTHYYIHSLDGSNGPKEAPAAQGGETPASLGCVYGLVSKPKSGCPITTSTSVPTGGKKIIAIVDAYDYPSAADDLAYFSSYFGLPAPNFVKVFADGVQSGCSNGWAGEESLDIDMAHAMAPDAQIVLVEALTNSNADLYSAVEEANSYIAANGGKGEVSMSWGGSEYSGENENDDIFTQSGVVYFASTGDTSGTEYPSVSPNVIAVGATQINRSSSGSYTGQAASKECDPSNGGCGGGKSLYESRPSFQSGVSSVVGTQRGVPDIASDGASKSPVWVYNTACYGGWGEFYGTSVASPTVAGIVNNAGTFNASTNAEATEIYDNMKITSDYTDIKSGSCGTLSAKTGYDLCTGVGADKGKKGK